MGKGRVGHGDRADMVVGQSFNAPWPSGHPA
jgi:hypothetical protein